MSTLPGQSALKEWASVISALDAGDQFLLVRKGGIADPSFGVDAERFYLYPTYLHQEAKQFRPEGQIHLERSRIPLLPGVALSEPVAVSITNWCEVVCTWHVTSRPALHALAPWLIFTAATLEERFLFRRDQAVHVIAVNTFRLPTPATVSRHESYAGCRSWIHLADAIDAEGSQRVIAPGVLQGRVEEISVALRESR